MKKLSRYLTLTIAAAFLAVSASVYAAPCCDEIVEKAKKGKACAFCAEKDCCKEAVKRLGEEAKACSKARCKKKAGAGKEGEKKEGKEKKQ
ncbi:MAG: hypothetical protein HZA91_18505 [Verrucomicrobia bacterium]|nr:hypothetical protein [Verrucomicrobiota bacterium]